MKHYLYIIPLALLAACNSNDALTDTETSALSYEHGPIQLSAGIVEGSGKVMTRAGAEDSHIAPGHQNLGEGGATQLALQVSGTWTGHTPEAIILPTTATIGTKTGTDNLHNTLSCDPLLYWDDFGSADEANKLTGRAEGLTIYGAAINNKATAPTISSWTTQEWAVPANQSVAGNTPADHDLLISNNVQGVNSDPDDQVDHGRYLFEKRTAGKLLAFQHALSKMTVYLKTGTGFPNGDFEATPDVWLTSNTSATSLTEWPLTTGTVDITTGGISSQATPAAITMCTSGTPLTGYQVSKEALVFPGSEFTSDNAVIAKIQADGNVYYVTAKEIRTAMDSNHATDGAYATEPGKNYVLKILVNKTDVVVSATVTNWDNVEAAQETPVINVAANFGTLDSPTDKAFSFYLSESRDNGYGDAAVDNYYPAETTVSYDATTKKWSMASPLYWPTHHTHYQFRGVWPTTSTEVGTANSPRVEDGTGNTAGSQVIKVKNVAYTAGTFPSDLMIARPEVAPDATCHNDEHTTKNLWNEGICATEGTINLNFRYMMAQVEVNLSTSGAASEQVRLTDAVVELVNVKRTGDVKLGTREVVATGSTGSYPLDEVTGTGNEDKRLSAIVPQQLEWTSARATTNAMFKITIKNADNSTDIYYADIAPIKTASNTYVAQAVDTDDDDKADRWFWESGKRYVYDLLLKKTAVKVTATITDWMPVNAAQEVWF